MVDSATERRERAFGVPPPCLARARRLPGTMVVVYDTDGKARLMVADGPLSSWDAARHRRSRRLLVVASMVAAVGLSGVACGSGSSHGSAVPAIAVESPVATALSWFAAVNARDKPLALAHFAPADRGMMEWSSWGPPFRHLQCAQRSGSATSALVTCTVDKIDDPDVGMSNTTFWAVSLQRQPPGPWLINNYGQG